MVVLRLSFQQAKPQAVIISIGRGPIIDEEAMTQMLQDGRLRSASCDNFPTNYIFSPLMASWFSARRKQEQTRCSFCFFYLNLCSSACAKGSGGQRGWIHRWDIRVR